jgi:hypothetical protein
VRRPRFSVASLLLVVLFAGVGFAALRESTSAWDSSLLGMTVLVLLIAVFRAVRRIDGRRAFWLGIALYGWSYLGTSLVPQLEARLLTTKGLTWLDSEGLAWLDSKVGKWTARSDNATRGLVLAACRRVSDDTAPDADPDSTAEPGYMKMLDAWQAQVDRREAASAHFIRIGHSIIALVLAFLGGHFSLCLYVWSQRLQGRDEVGRSRAAIG